MTPHKLKAEVSDNIMLGFSYLQAYAVNDTAQQQLFEQTYGLAELNKALLIAYDQQVWLQAHLRGVTVEEYLENLREYLTNFTETVRVTDEDSTDL